MSSTSFNTAFRLHEFSDCKHTEARISRLQTMSHQKYKILRSVLHQVYLSGREIWLQSGNWLAQMLGNLTSCMPVMGEYRRKAPCIPSFND